MTEQQKICKGINVRENEKGSGIYYVVFTHAGERARRRVGNFNDAVEYAELRKAEFLSDPIMLIRRLNYKQKKVKVPTFAQAVDTWFEEVIKRPESEGGKAPSTIQRYEQVYHDNVKPHIGSMPCDMVTPQVYADLLKKYRHKKSNISVINRVVSGSIMYAVNLGQVNMVDPTSGITKALGLVRNKMKEASKTVECMKTDQMESYMRVCAETEPQYYEVFAFILNTGCRMGEACGLTWDNIDYQNYTVLIEKAVRKGRMGMVKNRQKRTLQLQPDLLDMLKALRQRQMKDGVQSEFVFPSTSGNCLAQSTLDNANRRILKRAKLPYFNIHRMRHTFATESINNGVDLRVVGDYLGHHDTRVTQINYTHLTVQKAPDVKMIFGKKKGGNVVKFRDQIQA